MHAKIRECGLQLWAKLNEALFVTRSTIGATYAEPYK